MASNYLALEHKVLRLLRELEMPLGKRILIAVSGGVDSMVLAEILVRWQRALGFARPTLAYVHHGESSTPAQTAYRKQARDFVATWAKARNVDFITNRRPPRAALTSEQDLRKFRLVQIEKWRNEGNFATVAWAHHQDDLLETRLIRLLRGSGGQGLRAMRILDGHKLRPLLFVSRQEILDYASARGILWLEDPSNRELGPLRNWLRQDWLPALEDKRPGAKQALARSLETLAPEMQDVTLGACVGLRRKVICDVALRQQREMVARYLKTLGVSEYAQTHVNEILKRLKGKKPSGEFEMLHLRFQFSPDFLWASRV